MATEEGKACAECMTLKTGGGVDISLPAFDPLVGMMSGVMEGQRKMVKEFTIDTQLKPIVAFIELPAKLASLPGMLLSVPPDIPGVVGVLTGEVTGIINDTFAMLNDMLAIVADPVGGLKDLAFGPLFDNLKIENGNGISLKVPDFPSIPSFLVGLDFGEYGGSERSGPEPLTFDSVSDNSLLRAIEDLLSSSSAGGASQQQGQADSAGDSQQQTGYTAEDILNAIRNNNPLPDKEFFNSIKDSLTSLFLDIDLPDINVDWAGSDAQAKFSKFAMAGMLPSMDPLFFSIEKIQASVMDTILGLPTTLATAIAGPIVGLPTLISDVNKVVATFEEILSIIPPTSFLEEKFGSYFEESGIEFPPELGLDFKGTCVDCIMEQIPSLIV